VLTRSEGDEQSCESGGNERAIFQQRLLARNGGDSWLEVNTYLAVAETIVFDLHVAFVAPGRCPLVFKDKVVNAAARTITNQGNSVVQVSGIVAA